jgi:DNA-directed RNA polymerase subunit E'
MFRLVKVKDVIRVPPEKFGEDLRKIAIEQLREKFVRTVSPELGLIIAVTDVDVKPEGVILPGDGATYHVAEVEFLTYYPINNEVVEGEVVDVKKIGIFVNIGPIDAFVHISQIADDRMMYDEVQGILLGEETKLRISRGDIIRGRIVNVSIIPPAQIRVAMTMRQPSLGKIKEGFR